MNIIFAAGELVLLSGLCVLAWLLFRERSDRAAAIAALAERQAIAEERSLKLALLDRRLAIVAPLEDLRIGFGHGCRPDARSLAAAARALGEARILFPASLAAATAEVGALLRDYERNRAWQSDAVGAGRHDERTELAEAAVAIEQALKPKLAALASSLAEAARPEG